MIDLVGIVSTRTVLDVKKIILDFQTQDRELLSKSQRMFPNSIV